MQLRPGLFDRPFHRRFYNPAQHDEAGESKRGPCRKLRARHFKGGDGGAHHFHRRGVLIELAGECGYRLTAFRVPAVADLAIFVRSEL
jgi:hypothetical protein